jgi:hypothetical protein
MNQTGMLQRQGDFPSNIRYEFSETDKRFLSTAPASFVQPGGVPFGRRPQRVGEMATDEEIPVTAGLSFTISTAVESYQIGEPVWLRMSLRNDSDAPVEVDANFSGATGLVDIAIRDPLNQETIFRPCYFECIEADVIELKPGEEVLGNLAVFFGADGYSFPIDGAYQLSATYQASIDGENVVTVLSNTHEFEVKESQSSADIDYSDALMISPTQALFMILGGGSHLEGAVDSLTNIVRKYGDSRSAQFARLSLAQNTLREAAGNASVQTALKLLEDIDLDVLDLEQRADVHRATSQAHAMAGSRRKAADGISRFRDVAARGIPSSKQVVAELVAHVNRITDS